MSKHPLAIILFIALTMLAASASAEVGQKRSKCEEGIGCRDEQKKAPDAPKYAPKNDKAPGNMKATSPGLGVGVTGNTRVPGGRMEPLPGAGGYAGSTPAEQAFLNEVCGSRQEQAELEPYQSSRRVLAPELNATDCIQPGTSKSSFGPGFKNVCPYWVVFRFCAYKPAPDAWTEAFDCEKTGGGTEIIGPRREIAAHTANAEQIHWAGCRHPEGTGTDYKFIAGQGYRFNCMAWQSGKVREAVAKSKAPACEVAEVAQDAAVQAEVEQLRAQLPTLVAQAKQDEIEERQRMVERIRQQQIAQQQAQQARPPTPQPASFTIPPGPSTWRCTHTGGGRGLDYAFDIATHQVVIRSFLATDRDSVFTRQPDGTFDWMVQGKLAWKMSFSSPEKVRKWHYISGALYGTYDCVRQVGAPPPPSVHRAARPTEPPPPPRNDDVNWAAVAKGAADLAGAYAASRGRPAPVPPAPLPPVQYKPYGQPAPAPSASPRPNQDANRYYPLLGCVANSGEGPSSYANGICAKNNCGRSVNMVWERGNTGVAAGGCYPSLADFGRLLGACEGSDLYDKSRRMCKK